jgi:hypothetical protein
MREALEETGFELLMADRGSRYSRERVFTRNEYTSTVYPIKEMRQICGIEA